jgi:mannose-6-phosphate isomerase-like protein (cupin superfamily)/GNAT superfamily N-acetyltransferase
MNEKDHYSWGNGCEGWHLVRTADLSVIKERMPLGTSEKKHKHLKSRQLFVVASGLLVIQLGGRSVRLAAGQALEVPPGAWHEVVNESQEDVLFLVTSQPSSQGDRVEALDFVRISESQTSEVLAVLCDAALRLREKGIRQWVEFADGGGEDIVKRRFAEGEVYMIQQGGESVGTITTQWEDPFWEETGRDGKAIWIHSIAVAGSNTGRGIGAEALRWTADQARQAGRPFIRLDCGAGNARLCRYYESQGFVSVGLKPWKHYDLKLYQLAV